MDENQTALGFTRIKLEKCPKCKLVYNQSNYYDNKFHQKLHKNMKIPKCIQLSENFYNKNNIYFYGIKFIQASCRIVKIKNGNILKNLTYDTENSKNVLIKNLKKVIKIFEIE